MREGAAIHLTESSGDLWPVASTTDTARSLRTRPTDTRAPRNLRRGRRLGKHWHDEQQPESARQSRQQRPWTRLPSAIEEDGQERSERRADQWGSTANAKSEIVSPSISTGTRVRLQRARTWQSRWQQRCRREHRHAARESCRDMSGSRIRVCAVVRSTVLPPQRVRKSQRRGVVRTTRCSRPHSEHGIADVLLSAHRQPPSSQAGCARRRCGRTSACHCRRAPARDG